MTDWELIFTMLGEKATADITQTRNAQGFGENKLAAQRGGKSLIMQGKSWSKKLVIKSSLKTIIWL